MATHACTDGQSAAESARARMHVQNRPTKIAWKQYRIGSTVLWMHILQVFRQGPQGLIFRATGTDVLGDQKSVPEDSEIRA